MKDVYKIIKMRVHEINACEIINHEYDDDMITVTIEYEEHGTRVFDAVESILNRIITYYGIETRMYTTIEKTTRSGSAYYPRYIFKILGVWRF